MDREQALDVALGQIERNFGKGAVMKMSDQAHVSVGAISTGSLSLDLALGIGGLPRGRIVEIFGPESSGKTTLVYHVIAEAQRRGGICAFIDAEHAMDPTYAKRIGVNIDELLVSQPDTGEQALEITELLIRSGALAVVAIDSVAALTPKAEIEGEMGDSHVGLQARLMSQALRKLAGTLNRTDTICIFTNQLREKIGVMFGNPETTPGGRALKFYSSVRLDIRRIETLKDGVEAIGNRCRVKVAKNKVAPPFKQAEFDIMYGEGISWEGTVLDTGLDRKIVTKSGSYFSLGDERLGPGAAERDRVPQGASRPRAADPPGHPEHDGAQVRSSRPDCCRRWTAPLHRRTTPSRCRGRSPSRSRSRRGGRTGGRLGHDVAPRVTALVAERRGRVRVDLDGERVAEPAGGRSRRSAALRRHGARPVASAHACAVSCAESRRSRSGRPRWPAVTGPPQDWRRCSSGAACRRPSGDGRSRRSSAPATSTTRASPPRAPPPSLLAGTGTRRSASTSVATALRRSTIDDRTCEPRTRSRARGRARRLGGAQRQDGTSARGKGLLGRDDRVAARLRRGVRNSPQPIRGLSRLQCGCACRS